MSGVDASIYGQFGTRPRSVADYDAEARQGKLQELALLQAQGQQAAGQRKLKRQEGLELLMRQLSPGATAQDRVQALRGGAYFDEADALEGADLKRQETGAKVGKDKAETDSKAYDLQRKKYENTVGAMSRFNTRDDAKNWLVDSVVRGDIGQDEALAMVGQIPHDPAKFGEWRDGTVFSLQDAAKQAGFMKPDANAVLSNKTSRENNAASNARQAAEGDKNRAVTIRGQNMTDSRGRDSNKVNSELLKVQLGQTKLEAERDKLENAREGRANKAEQALDTVVTTRASLDRLLKHGGLQRSTGIRSALPTIPGGEAADFEAQLDSFKAQTFLPQVEKMKGTGSLTDAEGKKLTDAVGALSLKMGPEAFAASLKRIDADLEKAERKARAGAARRPTAAAAPAAAPADDGWSITPIPEGK